MLQDVFLFLGQPTILWGLFVASILLVLLDYLLPVDWLAYFGYLCFSLFVGATIDEGPTLSLWITLGVALGMLTAHVLLFSRFLTNAPHIEKGVSKVGRAID